ncbi:hypothetical protein FPZ12_004185 [Amycolatopsis acidicola]|uniref:Uncharacterized protein n=1 Tax=Amycolatopsis acidicola TaxID=2596893 RepID=A0A5N0VIQ9_9PSEU|nr:hypothetical protein [Amycolatopsis acidicola]KAA9166146.1 hypothetical protein FPZ12_004185 [Amycolatopsis acidicola]
MNADSRDRRPQRKALGPIDPFCWCAAGPLFIIGIGLGVLAGNFWLPLPFIVLGGLLLLFDARVNRPDPQQQRRPPQRGPVRPPQRAPGRQVPPRSRQQPPGYQPRRRPPYPPAPR